MILEKIFNSFEKANEDYEYSQKSLHWRKFYGQFYKKVKKKGYFVNLHYKALHLNPLYKQFGFKKGDFPVSEKYSYHSISVPIYVGLKINKIKKFVYILKKQINFEK